MVHRLSPAAMGTAVALKYKREFKVLSGFHTFPHSTQQMPHLLWHPDTRLCQDSHVPQHLPSWAASKASALILDDSSPQDYSSPQDADHGPHHGAKQSWSCQKSKDKDMVLEIVLCNSCVLVAFILPASISESLAEFSLRLALLCQIMILLFLFEIYMERSIKLF